MINILESCMAEELIDCKVVLELHEVPDADHEWAGLKGTHNIKRSDLRSETFKLLDSQSKTAYLLET